MWAPAPGVSLRAPSAILRVLLRLSRAEGSLAEGPSAAALTLLPGPTLSAIALGKRL